ncbi:hypothetical protein MKW92_002430 [Papaver armeniacum]|nr:hypothetical protein MKW92_002430 [Papaver armeniacum]
MAQLFRDRILGESKRESMRISTNGVAKSFSISDLPSPFGELENDLSDSELRETVYEIFVGCCRSSGGKPLTYIPQSEKNNHERSPSFSSNSSSSSSNFSSLSLQRSLTSTAASKVKKALGMRSNSNKKSPGKEISPTSKSKKPVTVGELMRVQMRVNEATDSRIRRGLLRIAAGQLGRRIDSMVLPLELLQQFKSTDFPDQQEYEAWQMRNLKVLEAGLLSQRLQRSLRKLIETGKNNESMQSLRSAVMPLASRSIDGFGSDACHWADGFPLNLRLYQMLLEEIDEVLELIKKTWVILGMNQMLHNLCFTWVLFHRFVATGQTENDLLFAADNQLAEVAKDAKATKDPVYSKILNFFAYHDTFDRDNVDLMQSIVSLGVSAAKILVEDISHEYRRRRKEEVDVARNRIDTYIRSSVRTAFAQIMEQADSSRRSSRNLPNSLPVLAILAKSVGELACKEKEVYSPIFKRWHPLAAGVAVATLHVCYGNELKQFIKGIQELTPDAVHVLRAADKLEKDLVQIAVEDSVDSDDGGKGIIREMPPYEAETAMADLVRGWLKTRVDMLKDWVDRNLQQEVWNPRANKDNFAPSVVEVLRMVDETLDAFFQLPISMHPALLPDLMTGLDKCLLHYISKAKSGCGSRSAYIPTMPALTRCTIGSTFAWKKKEKLQASKNRKSQVGTMNGENSLGISQLCVRMNTLQHIRVELEVLEKRGKKFELSPAACVEAIQQLSEATAYKVVFHDLSHVLWEGLYVGEPSSARIEPVLKELEQNLELISETVHSRVRTRPSRSFSKQDSQIIEDDFSSLKDLYWSNGDGLPDDLIDKCSKTARDILPLFQSETESLIERFRRMMLESYGPAAKARLPLPATSAQWNPNEPNTLLRVLCYRNDDAASKFLKKTYNLPKKL